MHLLRLECMTKVPTVQFRYSWIYDQVSHRNWLLEHKGKGSYPNQKTVLRYRARLEHAWKKDGPRILRYISKTTGIPWDDREIFCYVVGRVIPFSDPMTMPVYKKWPIELAVDVLTHECIHRLLCQPHSSDRVDRVIRLLKRRYKKISFNTLCHIPVHAIHAMVYRTLFSEKRMQRDRDSIKLRDYQRAWKIVDELGADNIVRMFLK